MAKTPHQYITAADYRRIALTRVELDSLTIYFQDYTSMNPCLHLWPIHRPNIVADPSVPLETKSSLLRKRVFSGQYGLYILAHLPELP